MADAWPRRAKSAAVLALACLVLAPAVLERAVEPSADLPHDEAADLARRAELWAGTRGNQDDAVATAHLSPSYRLSLGLMVDERAEGPVDWDVEDAVDGYLKGFLEEARALAAFSINTQVLYFSRLSRGANTDRVAVADLEAFMSANDWNVSPLQDNARERVVHLMAFLPDDAATHIENEHGDLVTAFYVPRWGGVSILPLRANETTKIPAEALKPTMTIFEQFVRAAMGISTTPGATITNDESARRAKAYVLSATQTLTSLSDFVRRSAHMIVPDRVANDFKEACAEASRAIEACQSAKTEASEDCLSSARRALVLAEDAFFAPSLLPQLYFPPEHWFAVYMPFSLPAALPLLTGLARVVASGPWKKASAEKKMPVN